MTQFRVSVPRCAFLKSDGILKALASTHILSPPPHHLSQMHILPGAEKILVVSIKILFSEKYF